MPPILEKLYSWWDPGAPIRDLLEDAREYLPGDTPNPVIDDRTDEFRLKHYHEFIEHTEYQLALEVLIYIADACDEDGQVVPTSFWKYILQAAEMMEMSQEIEICRSRIEQADERTKSKD